MTKNHKSENYSLVEQQSIKRPVRNGVLTNGKYRKNISRQFSIFVLFVSLIWLLASSENIFAATRTASATGNWNQTATWGGSSVPVAGDTVYINSGVTVTVTANAACASISWASPSSSPSYLTVNSSVTLDVSGNITTTASQGTKIIDAYGTINAGSITLASNASPAGIGAFRIWDNGVVNITGDFTFSGTLCWFAFAGSSSGTLNIGGNLGSGCSYVWTAGPGTINFNGTSAQTIGYKSTSAGYTFNILKINNTAGVTPASGSSAGPNITTLTIADVTSGSVFNDGAYTIATATTLNLNSGTYNCTAATFPWGTLNAGTGTVNYSLAGAQTVANKTYYNLGLSGSGNKTFSTAGTISNTLSISGSAKAALPNSASSNTTTKYLYLGGTGEPAGTWGSTTANKTYKNDTYFTSSLGYVTVSTTVCTTGSWLGGTSTDWNTASNWCGGVPTATTDVTISSGTTYQPNIGSAGGLCRNITINNGATLTMGGAYSLTVSGDWTLNTGGTFTPSTSIVTFNGTGAQAINGTAASQTFYNVTLTKTAGTTLSVSGSTISLTVNNLTETTGNFTAPATLNINGTATLTAGTFTAGANTNVGGDWTNYGAMFTHSSGTVTFNGTFAQALGGSAGTTFNNLTINNSAGVTLGNNETVSNTLTLTSGKVATTASYYLAVTNTSSSAVTGYSSSSYINGSLRWSLATGSSYLFPVGDASNYRPFELNSITCSSPVVQVTMSSTGASTVDSTLSAVAARNWYAQLISGSFTSATVRITESGLNSTNVVASSSAQSGNYTNRGGNSIGSTITSTAGISYTGSTYFAIGVVNPPALTVVKSANPSPNVNPGQIITYTVQASNSGSGTATSVELTDHLSPYVSWSLDAYGSGVPFSLTQGSPASGLTIGTPVYSNDNGSTWVYTPVSGGGGALAGYDSNVTNWKIPMNGTMNAGGANFTINYKASVK
jgi:hypothetical protein